MADWDWSEWVFKLSVSKLVTLPDPRVVRECEKYGMRAVFDLSRRTYLVGSGDTLYGEVPEESCIGAELSTAIAELSVTGPFKSIT